MNQLLTVGSSVQTASGGLPCKVVGFLGGGGQGEVYRAELAGQAVALKWYFPHQATADQRNALAKLVQLGSPNTRFLWPMDLAESSDRRGFGYVMALRDPGYKSIADLMRKRIDPPYKVLATAGMELSDSFKQLHAKGLSYRDISFGNVFFNPDGGGVLICDNDNVAVDGAELAMVLGTPGFMAPEIVCRRAKPSTQTDLYSLSVLLFYLLVVAHPLDGLREASIKCLDLPAREKLYGTDPLFIFDPADDSNRPRPGYHDNAIAVWPILPSFLRELFTKAFTDGLHDPDQRIRESEWRKAMATLRDSVFYCLSCGAENFHDHAGAAEQQGQPGACWHCGQSLRLPPRLRIDKAVVLLNHDTLLYPHHFDADRRFDFGQPVAQPAQHPQDPNRWGLKNLSDGVWDAKLANGRTVTVEPGKSVPLVVGTTIRFGKAEGEVCG